MCLSGELLISWARSRHSLNVCCKYSPASCRGCLINMAEDPPGRSRWCECDGRRLSNSQTRFQWLLLGAPRAGGWKVSWREVDLQQKYVSGVSGWLHDLFNYFCLNRLGISRRNRRWIMSMEHDTKLPVAFFIFIKFRQDIDKYLTFTAWHYYYCIVQSNMMINMVIYI